ncbi:hypothetical protein COU57_06260 [Candidatus Pacearchaeota archaeon CG10_big_fil_rev_8_21_14_0_10_32_14]|nr:MAG: hypothetical protein COU57_06260 [Candidatus Pacearchaeota archaeon CG10_big_fil_rev_8_21_14_0_10_32_14]
MNHKKTLVVSLLFFILILTILPYISAQSDSILSKSLTTISSSLKDIYIKSDAFIRSDKPLDILGFTIPFSYENIAVGFFAGVWMWFVYLIIRLNRVMIEGHSFRGSVPGYIISKRDEEEIRERKTQWLYLVAGRFWKVFFIAIIFAFLTYIPILNIALRIITFENINLYFIKINVHWFYRSFIVAFELGFLPTFFEMYQKAKIRNRILKKEMEMKRGMKLNEARGRVK